MIMSLKDNLSRILLNGGIITEEQLKEALQEQRKKGGSLSRIIYKKGFADEKTLMACLSEQLNIPPINLSKFKISKEVIETIPKTIAKKYSIIPISKMGKTLTIAMLDPLNVFATDDLKSTTGYEIDPVIATEKDILNAIDQYYQVSFDMKEILKDIDIKEPDEKKEEVDLEKLLKETEEAPVVKMVNVILAQAIKEKASDVHIEPEDKALRIRYRIDGVLYERLSPPKKLQAALISRIKIMSNLDIAERRLPQDGRMRIVLNNKEIDFRVSILPIVFGEKVVLRILDKSSLTLNLEKLGFGEKELEIFTESISKPHGMILLTGPTGSGKTTTLYSALSKINAPTKNIITVEDPVEYQLKGINQVHARSDIGLTFASGLRSILRQDPDIIMVGEIRDLETADIAIKSALTGHLVFSTLHTNDAPGAITRLIDMGIEPFLLSSSLIMVAAQRLMRKICENCKEEVNLQEKAKENFVHILQQPISRISDLTIYKGKGCELCSNTGYKGRVAVVEILKIDDEIKQLIMNKATSGEIKETAVKSGMRTLQESGISLIKNGTTTIEEVLRVTAE